MSGSLDEAIALVGMAGRFPGAAGPEELWQNTLRGRGSVLRRSDARGAVSWARGELNDVASFDPAFFGMSSRDAIILDPQHRILLECAWEALADASISDHKPIRRTAVFAAANYSGYRELLDAAAVSAVEFEGGNDKDFIATTIGYRLGLEGPCMTVQTACSSSLVAVHLASQALLEYEADQALAGGASIVLPHAPGWRFEPRGIHSADGTCRPFDADADGTVMGDGAGMVVLRRLEDAIADGCRIYAVLRGSAVNNDGSRKIGYSAPSVSGQAEAIRTAQARAGTTPDEISYIEAHGTGTPLGDRVEIQALVDVFASIDGTRGSRCALGSAKGALGHLDVASGVVGLIRASLAMHHAVLPGTVNHRRAHPELQLEKTPFFIPRAPIPWNCAGPRRAGVSSFGVGGTNAHVVIEQYAPGNGPHLRRSTTLAGSGYHPRRYWPSPKKAVPTAQPSSNDSSAHMEYHRAIWRQWSPQDRLPEHSAYSRIILLADPDETGDRLHTLLSAEGREVVRAESIASVQHALASSDESGHALLICAWALANLERDRRSYDALTILAAGRLSGTKSGEVDVVLLSRSVFPVMGNENGDPSLAALTGLARVISMEVPSIRVRMLDVVQPDARALAEAVHEALSWIAEPVLARRGQRWWVPTFEPVAPPSTRPVTEASPPSGACVVLGAGTVGVAAARVLARAGRTVVLAARPGTGTDRASVLASEMTPRGGTVITESCDAADPAQIDALLTRVAGRFGALDQVVLAAGISGDAAYQPTGALPHWQDEGHFRVKVDGVAALGTCCAQHRIRRIVLMSSLAGVLGAISLGPYSAAAAAMDCYAVHLDGRATAWLSVAWDAWHHDNPTASAHERAMVEQGLSADEAEDVLSHALLSDVTGHLLVVKQDFATRWERFVRQPLRRPTPTKIVSTAARQDSARWPRIDRHSDLPQSVLEAWRGCLSEPTLGLDDDVVQIGADSLNSIEVLASLSDRFGVSLPTDLVFQSRTPRELAEMIGRQLAVASPSVDQSPVRHWHEVGPMIWCLHPISGSADCFGPLAELLNNYQVRAVVGKALAEALDEDEDEDSIESRAERYHRLLAASGPTPSTIVGWSYGGILAFETARVVFASTGSLPEVILLDIPAPTVDRSRSIADVDDAEIMLAIGSNRAREAGRSFPADLVRLPRTGESLAFSDTIDRLRAAGLVPPSFTVALASRLASGYRRRMRAVERYRPAPYPGRLVLLRASESEFGDSGILDGVLPAPTNDPSWGWEALAGRGCTWQILDGHHSTLLQPPSVADVAHIVRLVDGAEV